MLFQLPTGKTIYLSIDEYLNLTDYDVQYLIASNSGESILNPFSGSAVRKNAKEKSIDREFIESEDDMDDHFEMNIDDLDPDDFPSYEGENDEI